MGSTVLAILDIEKTSPILHEVPNWFEDWEQVLSRFRIDSELSRLNASAGNARVVGSTMQSVLAAGLEAEELTGGLVNPLILEDLVRAGYDRTFDLLQQEHLPERSGWVGPWRTPAMDPLPALSSIISDDTRGTVCVPPGMGLDFGGVAKGWAAHEAAQRLAAAGPALVSAGGDIAVSGPLASGDPWLIEVQDPFGSGNYLELIHLENGGVATSGKDHRYWMRGGVFQHHIIDPRTRLPATTDILAATVVASTVMRAGALAKALLVSGSEEGLSLLEAHGDAEAFLVLDDGRQLYSRDFEKYL